MDKTTLSNYGWVVILIIIISVLIGLATPFATAIKNHYVGTASGFVSGAQNIFNNIKNPGHGSGGEQEGNPDDSEGGGGEQSGGSGGGGEQGNSGSVPLSYVVSYPVSKNPAKPDLVENAYYAVTGAVANTTSLKSITINGMPVAPLADGSWSMPLTLVKDVITEVAVVITDASNKVHTETRYVSYVDNTAYALVLDNSGSSTNPVPMVFAYSLEVLNAGSTFKSDTYGELPVLHAYTEFEDGSRPWNLQRSTITSVVVEDKISPASTASWFSGFTKCSYFDLAKLDVSSVTNMSEMFSDAGRDSAINSFSIAGLDSWDTSSVTNMRLLFAHAGYYATSFSLDLSNWDTSSVTNMEGMFAQAGRDAQTFELIGLENWDVSSVTDMGGTNTVDGGMFSYAGYSANEIKLDLSGWDVSSVTDMIFMFRYVGYEAGTINVNLSGWKLAPNLQWHDKNYNSMFNQLGFHADNVHLNVSGWDTSHITNMKNLFSGVAQNSASLEISGLENWNTASVTDMSYMFNRTGGNCNSWTIGDLSKWNTVSVNNMNCMFYHTGKRASSWSVGNISGWSTSNVTTMTSMFECAGQNASTWSIGDISVWDTSNVTQMNSMFFNAGKPAPRFLDLSTWSVGNVTTYYLFHDAARVVAPAWPTTCEVPAGTTSIASKAFAGDSRIEAVIIPKSVASVGENAFNGCSSLTDVYYTGTEDEWNTLLANIAQNNGSLTNATIHYNYAGG